jgi:hypothetical protein
VLGTDMFLQAGDGSISVTVKVPSGAAGYGTIPAAYSGNDNTGNWGDGFRAWGWNGSSTTTDTIYSFISGISLTVEYE